LTVLPPAVKPSRRRAGQTPLVALLIEMVGKKDQLNDKSGRID
jgi:hypothetical protein